VSPAAAAVAAGLGMLAAGGIAACRRRWVPAGLVLQAAGLVAIGAGGAAVLLSGRSFGA
jgi:hypothetical protein